MDRPWAVATDRTCCIGSGMCSIYAPATFAQDDEAKVIVLGAPVEDLDDVRTAVEACPTGALQLIVNEGR